MISLIETVDLQRGGGGVVKRSGSTTEIYIFIKYILFGPTPTPENNLDRPLAKLLIRSALREDTFVGLFWGYVRKSKAISFFKDSLADASQEMSLQFQS